MKGKITERSVAALTAPSNTTDGYIWDSGVPGFGVRVRPSGYKVFVFKYQRPRAGRQRWLTIGRVGPWKVAQARLQAEKHLGDVAHGHNPISRVVLAEFAERFFAEGCSTKKPSTMRTHQGTFRNHIQPLLGARPVRNITEREIDRAITKITGGATAADYRTGNLRGRARVRGGKGAAGKAARLLLAIFRFAQQIGLRSDNPAAAVAKQFPMYKQPDARRSPRPPVDKNPSADLRRVIEQHYGAMPEQLKKEIDRALAPLVRQLADLREDVGHVRKHQVDIAREVGAVEKPVPPRSSRRRPLGF